MKCALAIFLILFSAQAFAHDLICKSSSNPLGIEVTFALVKSENSESNDGYDLILSKTLPTPDTDAAPQRATSPSYSNKILTKGLRCTFSKVDPQYFSCSHPTTEWHILSETTTRKVYTTSRCGSSKPQMITTSELTLYVTPDLTKEAISSIDKDVFFNDYWGLYQGDRIRFNAEDCTYQGKTLAQTQEHAC